MLSAFGRDTRGSLAHAAMPGDRQSDVVQAQPLRSSGLVVAAIFLRAAQVDHRAHALRFQADEIVLRWLATPALISASSARLLSLEESTRLQKSNRSRKSPPSLRASTMLSHTPWPTPFTAPSP